MLPDFHLWLILKLLGATLVGQHFFFVFFKMEIIYVVLPIQLRKMVHRGQEVVIAGAAHALHHHEKLAIAVSKAMRSHSLQETKKDGRFHVHTRTYLDGSILKEVFSLAYFLLKWLAGPRCLYEFYIEQNLFHFSSYSILSRKLKHYLRVMGSLIHLFNGTHFLVAFWLFNFVSIFLIQFFILKIADARKWCGLLMFLLLVSLRFLTHPLRINFTLNR